MKSFLLSLLLFSAFFTNEFSEKDIDQLNQINMLIGKSNDALSSYLDFLTSNPTRDQKDAYYKEQRTKINTCQDGINAMEVRDELKKLKKIGADATIFLTKYLDKTHQEWRMIDNMEFVDPKFQLKYIQYSKDQFLKSDSIDYAIDSEMLKISQENNVELVDNEEEIIFETIRNNALYKLEINEMMLRQMISVQNIGLKMQQQNFKFKSDLKKLKQENEVAKNALNNLKLMEEDEGLLQAGKDYTAFISVYLIPNLDELYLMFNGQKEQSMEEVNKFQANAAQMSQLTEDYLKSDELFTEKKIEGVKP